MRKNINFYTYRIVIFGLLLTLFIGCKKDENNNQKTPTTPTVYAQGVGNIAQVSATAHIYIGDDGGSPVTSRGICWKTTHNPTTSDDNTANGSGVGYFDASITGLTINTTYFVRAYAINSVGIAYSNEIGFSTALAVGQSYQGGKIGYIYKSGDNGCWVNGETHGFIIAPYDQSDSAFWLLNYPYHFPIGTSTNLNSGLTNTQNIIFNCPETSIAARLCSDLVLNGYDDWYLPSKDELDKIHLANDLGNYFGFHYDDYWSSSEQNDSTVWVLNFSLGTPVYGRKKENVRCHVRAVRRF